MKGKESNRNKEEQRMTDKFKEQNNLDKESKVSSFFSTTPEKKPGNILALHAKNERDRQVKG